MREATGSTWSFMMMILFTLIFACFLTLVLSYSKAYIVKNRMLSIVEKYEGITSTSADIINSYVAQEGYKTTGACPTDWTGAIDLKGNYEKAVSGRKYYYCFNEISANNDKVQYEVMVFFKFNLPVIGQIFTYRITGETNSFYGSKDRIVY